MLNSTAAVLFCVRPEVENVVVSLHMGKGRANWSWEQRLRVRVAEREALLMTTGCLAGT